MFRLVQIHTFKQSHLENSNFGPALIKGQKGKLEFLKKLLVDFLSVWLRRVLGHPVIIWHWNQLTHSHSNLMWETWSISDPLLPRHHIYKYIILILWVALAYSHWLWLALEDHSWTEYTCSDWYQTQTFKESHLGNIQFWPPLMKGQQCKLDFL